MDLIVELRKFGALQLANINVDPAAREAVLAYVRDEFKRFIEKIDKEVEHGDDSTSTGT